MIIKCIHVRNYRSIRDQELQCGQLTTLVGPNGCGKSSFLRALELFYAPTPRCDAQDFYANDTAESIQVAVTFTDLDADEKRLFASYVQGKDLTVVRVMSFAEGKLTAKYHGATLQNPDFHGAKSAARASEAKTLYEQLRATAYRDLPRWTTQQAAMASLSSWEAEHSERCERQPDDGQFFGFTEVARGYLGRFTRLIVIPAVRDAAADAAEGRGSTITQIMDLVVRSALANREELKQLRAEMQTRYDEIMDPEGLPELAALEGRLTRTLRSYVPDARVELLWGESRGIDVPMPQAEVKLVEDGYSSPVARTGHGLQRAFILTMLQHLAVAQPPRSANRQNAGPTAAEQSQQPTDGREGPNLVLAIEEPELYQHPNRQRRFADVLLRLAEGELAGVAKNVQVIYSTHSPLMVRIDRFDHVRRLTKVASEASKPRVTTVAQATLDSVARVVWEADGGKAASDQPTGAFSGVTLAPRLQTLMTPWMNEGFFADVVVLVEGEDDRAAVLGVASSMGYDLESMGISVIPCDGKENLDRPTAIFRSLRIPVYVVWDSDCDCKSKVRKATIRCNRRLLRLMGAPLEDFPDLVSATFACFRSNLETVLRAEVGEPLFVALLAKAQSIFSYSEVARSLKSPMVVKYILDGAARQGSCSETLKAIVSKILELAS